MIVVDTNLVAYAVLPGERTAEALTLAARGRISAWDAESVFVADALGLPLVTAAKRLARAFPGQVVPLEDVIAGL